MNCSKPTSCAATALTIILVVWPSTSMAAAGPEQPWVITLGSIAPASSTYLKIVKEATDNLEMRTKGRVRFKIFASGVRGDEPEMVEQIRKGELSGGLFTLSGIGRMSEEFTTILLPYVFRNEEEIRYVRERMFDAFKEYFRKHGFELIAWADIGPGHLFSRVPVRNLADFKARKVWVWPGEQIMPAYTAFIGIEPVPIPLPDVLTAMREEKVDTVIVNALGSVALGWYRELNYIMKWDAIYAHAVLVAGRSAWEEFPKGVRDIILEEVDSTLPRLFEAMRRDEDIALRGLVKRGLQVLQPDPEALAEFQTVCDEFQKKYVNGKPDLQKVLAQIHKHLDEYRSAAATRTIEPRP